MIEAWFGHRYAGVELKYAIEPEPLGTGGGIKLALQQVTGERVFLFNGDTLFKVPLAEMEHFHLQGNFDLTLAVKELTDFDRYGRVDISNGTIQAFHEKEKVEQGFINGGVYLLEKHILQKGSFPAKFSFEKDFLEKQIGQISCGAFPANGYFLDIGIPETYEQAQNDFRRLASGE
jgi:D-glycero-alpha-D-manno-heptose 1-phosphate guanylyltransferase